jgi:predicted Zn-ribbon and HTH transcriptional regulator
MRDTDSVAKVMVTKEGWRCERCSHEWVPRTMAVKPVTCPDCKSPYWDKPRRPKKSAKP